jgi:hypothetical protein
MRVSLAERRIRNEVGEVGSREAGPSRPDPPVPEASSGQLELSDPVTGVDEPVPSGPDEPVGVV